MSKQCKPRFESAWFAKASADGNIMLSKPNAQRFALYRQHCVGRIDDEDTFPCGKTDFLAYRPRHFTPYELKQFEPVKLREPDRSTLPV